MDYEIVRLNEKGKVFSTRQGTLIQCLTRNELKNNGSFIDFGTIYGGNVRVNQVRGDHYHKNKEEYFTILQGKVEVYLEDIITKERLEGTVMVMGDRIKIGKNIAHAIMGISVDPAIFFSYATKPFEEDHDTYEYKVL